MLLLKVDFQHLFPGKSFEALVTIKLGFFSFVGATSPLSTASVLSSSE